MAPALALFGGLVARLRLFGRHAGISEQYMPSRALTRPIDADRVPATDQPDGEARRFIIVGVRLRGGVVRC